MESLLADELPRIWSILPSSTKEICSLLGATPTNLISLEQSVENGAELASALDELKERDLVVERTYREELEEKARMMTLERVEMLVHLEILPSQLTRDERVALEAVSILSNRNHELLDSKRVQLNPDFGKFVEGLNAIEKLKVAGGQINAGETVVFVEPFGGQSTDADQALNQIKLGKLLQTYYSTMGKIDLEAEYTKLYSSTESYKFEPQINAILGVLVDKHDVTTADLPRLRGQQ